MSQSLHKTINKMRLRRLKRILKHIQQYEKSFQTLPDDVLQQKTVTFKRQLLQKETTLEAILPEAYALVREASRRVLGMFPKDVQVLGQLYYMKEILQRCKPVKVKH